MKRYDVVIIGGGVVGASIARKLSQYRLKIALLEKEEELAFGVSKSNSGIIHPGTQNPPDSLKGRLCVQGNYLMRKIAMDLGVDFKEVGELIVAFQENEIPELLRLKKEAELLGVPGLEIVDRAWLRKREPNLNAEACAALYAPTAGIVSPYRVVYDNAENAARNGAEIHTLAEVEAITKKDTFFEIRTKKGIFNAKYVVNSAGLFSDRIANMVGINDFSVHPRKGEEFLLDKKKENLTNHLIFPLPTKTSKGILIIKTSDGNPMIGPTAEDVKSKDDLSTSDEGFAKVISAAKRLVPSIDENDIISYFAGLRPASGKDFIIRRERSVPGFITVAGIQSPGLTAAPAIAALVCRLLGESGLIFKRKMLFHAHRKKTIHLFTVSPEHTKGLIKKDPAYGDIVCRCEIVSRKEIEDSISRGARTADGVKFRTRAQAGRCHGTFCTSRVLKILAEKCKKPVTEITKRGKGSEIVKPRSIPAIEG